jgi:hypothetical protein
MEDRGLDSNGSCQHGNEASGFIKGLEFLEQLRSSERIKKDSNTFSLLLCDLVTGHRVLQAHRN